MKYSKAVLAAAIAFTFASTSAFAATYLFDNFSTLPNKATDPNANWYVIQTGNNAQTYDYFAPGSSTSLVTQGFRNMVKLSITPDTVVGDYQNSELSDVNTGWVYGTPLPWKPTMNHPIVLEAKVKWGSNYNLDGTGGAIGSSGIWLWNVPVDYQQGTFQPMDAIGMSWAQEGSALTEGLAFVTFKSGLPRSSKEVADVLPTLNINDWNDIKIVWRQTKLIGEQQVLYYVNGTLIDSVYLLNPMDTLAVEIWNDNQKYQFTGAAIQDPTAAQDFFIDKIEVKQL